MTSLKRPEPFLSIPAQVLVQDNCHVYCGMVRKENKIHKWQDRYLVLHKGCLYYYKDSTDKNAQGQFSLSGYRLSTAPEKMKFNWTFKLTHIQPEKRKYFFAAHSEKELNEWLEKITEDMEEYCEPVRTKPGFLPEPEQIVISSSSSDDSSEPDKYYDYPEVEPPHFDILRKQINSRLPIKKELPSNQSDAIYCAPPDFYPPVLTHTTTTTTTRITRGKDLCSLDVSQVLKKSSAHFSIGQSVASFPPEPLPRPKQMGSPLKPKPLPKPLSCKFVPKSLPKPKVRQQSPGALSSPPSSTGAEPCEEEGEDYLKILADESASKKTTLERMRPDGHSFKNKHVETRSVCLDVLPATAMRLDYKKTDAIPLLSDYEGVYMVHSSSGGDINQALSVCTREKVKHYLIFFNEDGYALDPDGPRFNSLENLLLNYYEKPLPKQKNSRLIQPYT